MSIVNILNFNPIPVRMEQNVPKFCLANSSPPPSPRPLFTPHPLNLIVDRRRKAESNFLQRIPYH